MKVRHLEIRGNFTISLMQGEVTGVEEPNTKELKGWRAWYAITNNDTGVLEFETVHYFNALRYICDAITQETMWKIGIDEALAKSLEGITDNEVPSPHEVPSEILTLPENDDGDPFLT